MARVTTPAERLKLSFGERCLQLRKAREWSQLDMVRNFNVTLSYWQRIEKGKLDVRLTTMAKVAGWFDMSLAELLEPVRTPRGLDS